MEGAGIARDKYSLFNYSIDSPENKKYVERANQEFNGLHAADLDPKSNSPFKDTYELLRQSHQPLFELNGCYESNIRDIKEALLVNDYQTQFDAFKSLGTKQLSPFEWNFADEQESIKLDIASIYRACTPTNIVNLLNDFPAELTELQQQVNYDLADLYYKVVEAKVSENIDAHYRHEALCVFHLSIGSSLGKALCSYALAKICLENEFSLPINWFDGVSRQNAVLQFMEKARKQAISQKDDVAMERIQHWDSFQIKDNGTDKQSSPSGNCSLF